MRGGVLRPFDESSEIGNVPLFLVCMPRDNARKHGAHWRAARRAPRLGPLVFASA